MYQDIDEQKAKIFNDDNLLIDASVDKMQRTQDDWLKCDPLQLPFSKLRSQLDEESMKGQPMYG